MIKIYLQNISLEDLISWAEATAWDGEDDITQLIGFTVERLERICREAKEELYPAINIFDDYLHKEQWEILPTEQKKFKKLCKQFGEGRLLELFFEIGRLQGIREAWQTIVNQK